MSELDPPIKQFASLVLMENVPISLYQVSGNAQMFHLCYVDLGELQAIDTCTAGLQTELFRRSLLPLQAPS